MNDIRLPIKISDLVDEYNERLESIDQYINDYNNSYSELKKACIIHGTFVETIHNHVEPRSNDIKSKLLKSAWQAAYNRLQIDDIASAKDKKLFKQAIASPPPFTLENAKATFGDYFARTRFHILRGLAEAFTALDPVYQSHSNVKIGVAGLPKRIILNCYCSYSRLIDNDRLKDVINALAVYQNKKQIDYDEIRAMSHELQYGRDAVFDGRIISIPDRYRDAEQLQLNDRGITARQFKNGNIHLIFDKNTLLDINRALAEFYGDVLPDAEEKGVKPRKSTAVAKDLQFYWTPPKVVKRLMDVAGIAKGYSDNLRVLEPSCGDGRILDALREEGCKVYGIEFDTKRAIESRNKGHDVLTANFLDCVPTGDFDRVVMNPPFYGRHYVKHVEHALKFLKTGGVLVSVLPASARYDHKELDGCWTDLPVASFSDAGTNIGTTILKIVKR